jgi:RNA polymerase sigma-70 factor (ECF subfamily)
MTAIASRSVELEAPHSDVLSRAQAGDHDAFAQLISAHESMVYSLIYHFFSDRSRAEELAQDVFLQLYRNLSVMESEAHVLFWLRQVATRRCIDVARRSRFKAVSLDDAAELPAQTRRADPLLDRRLRQLIEELPDTQKAVVTLRYQEDLDPAEICRIVGMPVNTVKSHLHRALQALRRKLENPS